MAKQYEIDMCNGPLFGKILKFTLPLMASSILQLLFNAADMVVVGRYAGSVALAAVGSTSSLFNLLINVFIGLSIGANVAIAHYYGAKKEDELSKAVHTTIALSLVGGVFLAVLGYIIANPVLRLMGTPYDILPHAVAYMQVYFIGMPVTLLYNFGAAILRAVGDTKRPLYFLLEAGVINVLLNLLFVISFGMGVKGVALATIISQAFSAMMIVKCLVQSEGAMHLDIKKLQFDKNILLRILRVGLPAGFQSAVFSLSNVLIQSSVNSFGSIAVAGNTAASNIEGFVYNGMNAFHQTAISFVGQNMGAKKPDRVKKILLICQGCVFATGVIMGGLGLVFGIQLLGIYTDEADVIAFGMRRLTIILGSYFLCGFMDVMVGVLRGMGFSIMPMMVSLLGACGLRILLIFTVFQIYPSPEVLYLLYPITWTVTFITHVICYLAVARPRLKMS